MDTMEHYGSGNKVLEYLNQVPEYQAKDLARLALEITDAVFSRPGEEERYQSWLAQRRAMNR